MHNHMAWYSIRCLRLTLVMWKTISSLSLGSILKSNFREIFLDRPTTLSFYTQHITNFTVNFSPRQNTHVYHHLAGQYQQDNVTFIHQAKDLPDPGKFFWQLLRYCTWKNALLWVVYQYSPSEQTNRPVNIAKMGKHSCVKWNLSTRVSTNLPVLRGINDSLHFSWL